MRLDIPQLLFSLVDQSESPICGSKEKAGHRIIRACFQGHAGAVAVFLMLRDYVFRKQRK